MSTDPKTEFAKAWEAWKRKNAASFDLNTLTPGMYLENRLFAAFSDGWSASARECVKLMQVRV